MDVKGNLIKSWVFKKTHFFLVKISGQSEPVVISSRDVESLIMRKDGSISFSIDYNKLKFSSASSKQYFGTKKAEQESAESKDFKEYDPFNEYSYEESPDEDMDLLGYDEEITFPAPEGQGVSTIMDPTDIQEPGGVSAPPLVIPKMDYSGKDQSDYI